MGAPKNEKGQRLECTYVGEQDAESTAVYRTRYTYDEKTFRLKTLVTERTDGGVALQRLTYTYDPVGNITEIADNSDLSPILTNAPVEGHGYYLYDAIYRLIRAEGREHPGQQTTALDSVELYSSLPHANDATALRRYFEEYTYDEVGNIKSLHHGLVVPDIRFPDWTRTYNYAPGSNQLSSTTEPNESGSTYIYTYAYDEHGSMTRLPKLPVIQWDYADRMRRCEKSNGTVGTVYFTYDAAGQRVRKIYEHASYREERIYLGGYEIYRRVNSGTLDVHRTTLHVMDDQRRVAMVENTLADPDVTAGRRWRFQLDNHLGTATLELDHEGNVISYEEYHPYGTSAFRVQRSGTGFSLKRYRYTGKERDEETSLYYHGARYYAPWLGRWTAADPLGIAQPGKPDLNLYGYVRGKPLTSIDVNGMDDGVPDPAKFATYDEFAAAAPSPSSTEYLMDRWESVHGATSVAPKQSNPFDEETSREVVADDVASVPSEHGEGSNLTGSSAVTTYESSVRSEYLRQIKAASAEAVAEIDQIIASVNDGSMSEAEALKQAERVARTASEKRDAFRTAAQKKLLPGGRMLSEAIEKPLPFEQRLAMKGGPTLSGFRAVAVSAGKSRAIVSMIAKVGKVAGPVGLVIGGGLALKAVLEAPPEQQASVAAEEGAVFGASALGATGGTAIGVAGAGGIATALGLSGPPGWLLLGLGMIGGLGGGYIAGEGTRKGIRYAQGKD